jgi:sterol desaturase/sphingolipid hydroxylase (fatty acid hydroxylase superfamily)
MDWLRQIGEQGLFGIPAAWLPFVGFWLLLFVLVAAELASPLHAPPRESLGRLAANFGLGIINALIVSTVPFSTVVAAEWALSEEIGLLHLVSLPPALGIAATLIAWSLAVYVLHVLAHKLPLLWRVHRVHHGDTAMDLSTGVRHHPFEPLYNMALLCSFAVLLGANAVAIAGYTIVAAAFALWTHTNVRLPARADRLLRLGLVTPAAHNIHHSAVHEETDSNYGDVLIVWDRLFGTYRDVPRHGLSAMRMGLGDGYDEDAGRLLGQLLLPLAPVRSEARQERRDIAA